MISERDFFLRDVEKIKSLKVLIYLILTCGIYSFFWLYKTNRSLNFADHDSPIPQRGFAVLIVIPLIITIISLTINIILKISNLFTELLILVLWVLSALLSIKYVYDFCDSFGKITNTNGLVWYLFYYPGYFSLILAFYGNYITLFLVFFPIICITAMQETINYRFLGVSLRDSNLKQNTKVRKN